MAEILGLGGWILKNKFIVLCLTAVLAMGLLAGCGSSEDSADSSSDSEDAVSEEAYADVVSYVTDGEISAADVVYTVDGVDITAGLYFYWITYVAYQYEESYYNSYYVYPEMDQEFSDGTTMAENVLNYAYEFATYNACVYARAVEEGIELNDEYQEIYETSYSDGITELGEELWDTSVSEGTIDEDDYSDSEKEEWIQENGQEQMIYYLLYYCTTEEDMDTLYLEDCYAKQYRDDLYGEGGEYELTDDDIDDYVEEYDIYACRYIFFGDTSSELDDDELEEYYDEAEDCYEYLQTLSGDELDDAIAEYAADNPDGNTTGEACFSSSASTVDGLMDVLEDLEIGELGITEDTENGYFVLIRDEVTADTIISELEYSVETSLAEANFEELAYEWLDDAEIEDYGILDDFDIYDFYDSLEDLRDEIIDAA